MSVEIFLVVMVAIVFGLREAATSTFLSSRQAARSSIITINAVNTLIPITYNLINVSCVSRTRLH